MSWNGSDISPDKNGAYAKARSRRTPVDATPSSRHLKDGKKPLSPSPLHLFRLFLILLLLGAAVALVHYLFFRTPASNPQPATRHQQSPSALPDVTPAAAPTNRVETPPPAPEKPAEPEKPRSDIGRQVTNSYGKVYTIKYVNRPGVRYENGVAIEDKPLFENDALNELDAIYRTEPGLRIYGTFDAEEFDRNFVGAQLEKIEISPDDSEAVAARKQQVIDGMKYLREQLKAGAKPSDIVAETRRELTDLANFKDLCQDVIVKMKNDGCSSEDLDVYYAEVNKKLAARNIPPLLSPTVVRERLRAHSLLNNGDIRK